MSASDWKAQEADAKALGFVNDKGAAITHRPRPRLFTADSPAAAREGLAGKVAQMEKNLGVERTPEAYAKAVRAEKVEDLTVDERKALARLDDLEAKAAAGDEAAAKQLAQDARDFFADRRGQYSVDVVSAAQVLDDLGMQRAGRLALYRDMMFQEARRAANAKEPTAETRAAAADAIWQAATAHQMLVREMRGDRAGQRKLSTGERHAVARARQRIADSAQLSGVMAWARQNLGDEGVKRLERAMAGVQEQGATKAGPSASESMVDEAMQRYFERGYMVRAQSVTDRTPGVLSAGEVIEMARAGARARSAAGAAARVDGDAGATAAVEGTLLNFKQPAGRNMLGAKKGEPGDLAIPAEALVNWVRQNRREDFADNADGEKLREKDSKRSVDERFVEDLVAGISALVDSGLVQGGPYVIGADGKQQRFRGVDGVPDALQLPSMSGKEYKQEVEARAKRTAYAKAAERRKALQEIAEGLGLDLRKPADLARAEEILAARQEAKRQARIGKDQSKDEPITQDPLVGLVDNAQYIRQVEPGARSFVRGAGTRVPARSTARAVRKDPQVSTPAPDPLAAPTAYAEARDANASAVARKAAERQARLERSNKSAPSDETPLQRAARLKRLEESEASRTAEEVRRSLRTGVIKETPPVTRNIGGKEVTLIEGEKYREARRPQASPTVEVNESWTADEDDVTPLDTQLFLNEGQAEFDEQRQRSGDIPRTAYENRAGALRKAEDRAAPILDKLRSTVEGKPEHRQDAAGALADVRQRLRIAARKGQEGGVQYAFPLVHVLNPKVLGEVELQPQQARDFDMMRSALATLLADDRSLTPYERTQLAKALVDPMHTAKVTVANAQQVLNKGAQKYRDYRAQRLAERQAKKAAPEVAAAEAPKSNQPAGAGVTLTGKSPYLAKDQLKADRATKFIGRGSPRSSTAQYAKDFGALANTGSYTAADTVFVSAEGARAGRVAPDLGEIDKAVQAGAVILTDNAENRQRAFNVGEREVEQHLLRSGYVERAPGEWGPSKLKHDPYSLDDLVLHESGGVAPLTPEKMSADYRTRLNEIAREAMKRGDGDDLWRSMDMLVDYIDNPGLEGEAAANALEFIAHVKLVEGWLASAIKLKDDNAQVVSRLSEGTQRLGQLLRESSLEMTDAQRAVVKAVTKIAPDTEVRDGPVAGIGEYDAKGNTITVNVRDGRHVAATVLLHEGVHAATAHALMKDKELKAAGEALMAHSLEAAPWLKHQYGFANVFEFIAEAMSNPALQGALKEIKPSAQVKSMLAGRNLWDSFLTLVYKALGISRDSDALAQSIAIGAAAMRTQGTGGRKLNAQGAGKYEGWKTGPTARQGSGIASDADIDAARAYVQRVLGPKIKVEFENITGYSGEWLDAEQTIRLSTITNAGIVNVARHEAIHAFWSKFVEHNPKLRKTMNSLVNHEGLMRQLQRLLADEPAALEQLKDGEERLAYIHQFAMAGMLKLPHTPGTTVMAKVRKFLRRVFMMVSDTERAVDLLHSFEAGKLAGEPDAASRVIAKTLNQGNWLASNPGKLGALSTRLAGLVSPAHSILMNSVSPAAREIGRRFFANPGDERDGGEVGYLNARNQKIRQYSNVFRSAIDGLTTQQIQALTEALQNETPDDQIKDGAVREARAVMRGMFDRFYRYMGEEKGLRLGKVTKDYFPVVFDTEAVASGEFAQLLKTKYADKVQHIADVINTNRKLQAMEVGESAPAALSVDEVVDGIVSRIAHVNSLDDAEMDPQREDGVLRPWFASGEKRVLNFLDPEDRARFQEKDLIKTVTRYIHQGVRAAEYSSRFGRNGAQLHVLLKNAEKEIEAASQEMMKSGDFKSEKARKTWANRQYANVANAAGAMEGSLGNDVSEGWRKVNSAVVVYQNIRLLPLALFSSFVDPLGIVVRGGEVKDALNAFVRGMKEVARNWGDMIREEPAERQKDEWERLAEHAGVIDSATFSHLLADEYGSVYHKGFARRTNEMMFRANGLESWNRAMRVAATKSAVQFMLRHNQGRDQHSARWMKELGFAVGELPLDADGQLITRKDVLLRERPELTVREAEAIVDKVNSAIVRWVEGAILSPSAGQRPAWGSDPHFGMFWHLKQFAYSFHHTMLTRAKNEAGHGNYAPMGALAWYVPTMIGADITKGLMLGAGELPGYMQGYGAADWLQHGVERAGILGVGQFGLDAATDPVGVVGPMADQVWEAITDPIERTVVRAMPVNSLYSRAVL